MYIYVTKVSSPHLQALPFFCWKYIYIYIRSANETPTIGTDMRVSIPQRLELSAFTFHVAALPVINPIYFYQNVAALPVTNPIYFYQNVAALPVINPIYFYQNVDRFV